MPNRQKEMQTGMGDFLTNLAKWDVFVTWTFSRIITPNGCIYWVNRILKTWEKMAGQPIFAFWAVEQGDVGNLWHLHALVGNVGHLKTWCGVKLEKQVVGQNCCLLHSWPAGYSRVFVYDPNKGAGYYVAKYVAKQVSEWGLYGFPAESQGVIKADPFEQRLYRKHRTRNIRRSA